MKPHWQLAMLVTGCLIACSTMTCRAKEQAQNEILVGSHSSHAVVPTHTLHHIFENMPLEPTEKVEKNQSQAWKHYKDKLRGLLAVHFTDSVQIGLDRIKSGPLKAPKGEIIDVNTHLSPRLSSESPTVRGYGVQMKVKLD